MTRGRKSRQSNSRILESPTKLSGAQWAENLSRELRSAYEAGNKNALWKMIVGCALSKSLIPEWAASILEGADGYVASGELNSWNKLFGKPRLQSRNVIRGRHRTLEVWERNGITPSSRCPHQQRSIRPRWQRAGNRRQRDREKTIQIGQREIQHRSRRKT
jgi:hypothetical protein